MRKWKKKITALLLCVAMVMACTLMGVKEAHAETLIYQGVYRGVYNYGTSEAVKSNVNNFWYCFNVGGTDTLFRIAYDGGAYRLQNMLKKGYTYQFTATDGVIESAVEINTPIAMVPFRPVGYTPGLRTVRNFLSAAMTPVGTTLYVFGGGWNWQDTAGGGYSRTIGLCNDWVIFFNDHFRNYIYKNADRTLSYYPVGGFNQFFFAGLDCSGYVGWALYNTFETETGHSSYVVHSTYAARRLAERGWGSYTSPMDETVFLRPGDIVSMDGHVWISLGTCPDGSVLILHSSPTPSRAGQPGGGVQMSAIGPDTGCQAYQLADSFMRTYYPSWYSIYPAMVYLPSDYLITVGRFSWDVTSGAGLTDPDGITQMYAQDALNLILNGR